MRLQQLRLIIAIAESGSLRAVAEQMNVTQPALTKTLRLLEEEFGAALAVRSAKGVRLTAAGELLAARSAIVLREIDRAREEVAWQTSGSRTRVAIGVSPAAAISLLAGALGRLRQRWPTVRVRVVDAIHPRSLTMVRAGELDLAVGPLPSKGAGRDLQTRPLFEARNALVVRRGHPQSQVRHLAELAGVAWVLTGPVNGPGDPAHLEFAPGVRHQPPIAMECESFATLLEVLPHLDAVAIVPMAFFKRHGPRSGLVRLRITDPMQRITLHAAWRGDAPLTSPAASLLDCLEQESSTPSAG